MVLYEKDLPAMSLEVMVSGDNYPPNKKGTVNYWLHPRNDSQLLIPQVIAGEKGFLATTCRVLAGWRQQGKKQG